MILNPILPIWLVSVICGATIAFLVFMAVRKKSFMNLVRHCLILVILFAINLRPMIPGEEEPAMEQTMDTYVLFVVDDTISMLARDYGDDTERLTAVKADMEHIVDVLYGANFSLIYFNNDANQMCPFTNDASYIKGMIKTVYPIPELYAKGTSLNTAKDLMTSTLKSVYQKQDGKVIVFFISDGEITSKDSLTSFSGAAKFLNGGAVLGYGTEEGGNMYIRNYNGDLVAIEDTSSYPYVPAVSRLDEKNLKQVASDMGVEYIHMDRQDRVDTLLNDILNTSVIRIEETPNTAEAAVGRGYVDIYYFFVIPLLAILIWDFIAAKRKN